MLSDEADLHSVKSESFTGNVCNKSISELRDVRRMRTLPSNSFPCNVLDKNTEASSCQPVRADSSDNKQSYKRTHCGKRLKQKADINMHIRIDTLEAPHGCMLTEKPYACRECNKYFKHSMSLQRHRGTHRGEAISE